MITSIEEIKQIRKKLGLTQKELSKLSGVSQSAIAKIESGLMDPGFSITKKISESLENQSKAKMLRAKDVMNSPVKTINVETSIQEVVSIMKKKNFSQFPVVEDTKVIGIVSESNLLDAIMNKNKKLKEILGDVPPTIAPDSPISAIVDLLHYFPLVLVAKKGKTVGIITKTDVLMKQK